MAAIAALAAAALWFSRASETEGQPPRLPPIGSGLQQGFARATGPEPLVFPHDLGPHPDFQTEWWYYTGNLDSAEGQHFGYQLTFFRRALLPPALRQPRASAWAADQIYLAHFAVTDTSAGRYQATERFARGAAGLAGAQVEPYRAWLDDWFVELAGPGLYHLRAQEGGVAVDLSLHDSKGLVLQGDRGYSQKGPEPGNASYYFSQTRLESTGEVKAAGVAYPVSGLSWMDHEYSTSALAPNQVGWDWFSLQLDDGSELMLFQLRRDDGSLDPFSAGALIGPDGTTRPLRLGGAGGLDFQISVNNSWRSPHSGAVYPAG